MSCTPARLESARRWREAHREKYLAAIRRCSQRPEAKERHRQQQLGYAAQHREQERARAAEWRKQNPDKHRAMKRRYYEENSLAIQERTRSFRLNNPERAREWSREYVHRKRAGGGRITTGYRQRLWDKQSGLCNACSGNLTLLGAHVDHIVAISKGGQHEELNVQLLCPRCNRRKSAKDYGVFLSELRSET